MNPDLMVDQTKIAGLLATAAVVATIMWHMSNADQETKIISLTIAGIIVLVVILVYVTLFR